MLFGGSFGGLFADVLVVHVNGVISILLIGFCRMPSVALYVCEVSRQAVWVLELLDRTTAGPPCMFERQPNIRLNCLG